MTREEAIFCEKSYLGETNCQDCKYYGTDTCKSRKSHKMAIKALEQQPCEDCISRADVRRILNHEVKIHNVNTWKTLYEKIDNLPSIQPKEIYNKGWKDGAKATAYHIELCEVENPTIPLSVIEDIKAEIKQKIKESEEEFIKDRTMTYDLKSFAYLRGITIVKEIIDKHIADAVRDKESEG